MVMQQKINEKSHFLPIEMILGRLFIGYWYYYYELNTQIWNLIPDWIFIYWIDQAHDTPPIGITKNLTTPYICLSLKFVSFL